MIKELLLTMACLSVRGDICREKCHQNRIHGMKSADCYKQDIKQVPQCLRTDVEVIDLSYNRIRSITKNELSKYSNVRILYLSENMITEIEEEALEDKYSLQALDISYNAFTNIPSVIFRLPSLKKLYMSQNQNINIVDEIERAKPIVSPLEYLDVGFNELTTLPNLGILPTLIKYNVSGNYQVKTTTEHFAGLCNLEILVNNNFSAVFDDPCQCWNLETWLRTRQVYFSSLECEKADCNYEISHEDMATFNKCKEIYEEMILKSRILKITIPICSVLLLLLIAGIYFFIRHRKQKVSRNSKLNNASEQLMKSY